MRFFGPKNVCKMNKNNGLREMDEVFSYGNQKTWKKNRMGIEGNQISLYLSATSLRIWT